MNKNNSVKRALMAMELRYDEYHTGREEFADIEFCDDKYRVFKDDEESAKDLINLALLSECISEKCYMCEHCDKCKNEVLEKWKNGKQDN